METADFLAAVHVAERLKDATRHCYTSGGRRESVAEHCWRTALMALFLQGEFPEADMGKVVSMCLIHDLGEAFTGDIPAFEKTKEDELREESALREWVNSLPEELSRRLEALFREMAARESPEAKIYKALDGLEALISHNESDIRTWLPLEYELNLTYADDKVLFSPYMRELREALRRETLEKMRREGGREAAAPGQD